MDMEKLFPARKELYNRIAKIDSKQAHRYLKRLESKIDTLISAADKYNKTDRGTQFLFQAIAASRLYEKLYTWYELQQFKDRVNCFYQCVENSPLLKEIVCKYYEWKNIEIPNQLTSKKNAYL